MNFATCADSFCDPHFKLETSVVDCSGQLKASKIQTTLTRKGTVLECRRNPALRSRRVSILHDGRGIRLTLRAGSCNLGIGTRTTVFFLCSGPSVGATVGACLRRTIACVNIDVKSLRSRTPTFAAHSRNDVEHVREYDIPCRRLENCVEQIRTSVHKK